MRIQTSLSCKFVQCAYKKGKISEENQAVYILLDEIQKVDHFEKAIASFKATLNCSLFVTGSNSKLLCEYRTLRGIKNDDNFFYDYLKWGGFPQRFDLPDESGVYTYLSDLYSAIKYKDITVRQKIDHDKFDRFSAFAAVKDASPKYVLSLDKVDFSHDGITHLNIIDFLSGKKDIVVL
jgi:uncharacterized protein